MRQVGVHDDDELPARVLQTVDVGRAEAELLGAWPQDDAVLAVDALELFGGLESAVRAAVIDDDDFELRLGLGEVFDEQPHDDGQVLALVVGGKQDRVHNVRVLAHGGNGCGPGQLWRQEKS